MSQFVIDRDSLPKPWANPLVFFLRSPDGEAVEVEVEQSAAIEYQSAWQGGAFALALATQRTEYFVQSVEAAVERMADIAMIDGPRKIALTWSDLNP